MKKIAKYIGLTLVSATLIAGCALPGGNGKNDNGNSQGTNAVFQAGFNEEQYVWENFIVTTNRIESVK